jgi:hypothetical protein
MAASPPATIRRSRRLSLVLAGILAGLAVQFSPVPAETINYAPHYDFMLNPEAGFTRLIELNHTSSSLSSANAVIDGLRGSDHSIAWIVLDMKKYWNTNTLGNDIKNNLTSVLTRARTKGVKVVLRFRYHTQASFTPQEPSVTRQSTHLDQLATILNNNNDVIAWYQAGGLGAYGEWYYTSQTSATARKTLLDKMFSVLPSDVLIQVRTPYYKDQYEAAGAAPDRVARVGHYNDCFLTGPSDYGTYSCYPWVSDCLAVTEWKEYIHLDSSLVPVGGETCPLEGGQPETYNDCPAPHDEMAYLGFSMLNTDYYAPYLTEWQTQGCWPDIRRRLGYRFEIVSATVPDTIVEGQNFTVSVTVRNEGFAPIYDSRPVYIRILDMNNADVVYYWTGADPRNWLPIAGNYTITQTFTAPASITASQVKMTLWLPDKAPALYYRPEYSVRFANSLNGADVWDGAANRGFNVLKSGIPVTP